MHIAIPAFIVSYWFLCSSGVDELRALSCTAVLEDSIICSESARRNHARTHEKVIFLHSLTFRTQHGLHYRGEDSRRSWSSQMFSEHREQPEAEILTKAGMVPIKITAGEEVWEDFGAWGAARRVKAVFWHEKFLKTRTGAPETSLVDQVSGNMPKLSFLLAPAFFHPTKRQSVLSHSLSH